MAWNIRKQNMYLSLEQERDAFINEELPQIVQRLNTLLGTTNADTLVHAMLFNATEIRALLKDWDRAAFNV